MKNTVVSYDELLTKLSETLGMTLSFDENGSCDLLVGEATSLNIHRFEEEERLTLTSVVAEDLPEDIAYDLVIELMDCAINPLFEKGPAIGRDPQSGFLVAYLNLPIARLEPVDFPDIVEEFLKFAIYYAERLRSPEHFNAQEEFNPNTMLPV